MLLHCSMLCCHCCSSIAAMTSNIYTHTHTRLTTLCLGLPGWAGTRKVKPIWILLKLETVSGSGIGWAIYKSAPCFRQIDTPAPHHLTFRTWLNRQRSHRVSRQILQLTDCPAAAVLYLRPLIPASRCLPRVISNCCCTVPGLHV